MRYDITHNIKMLTTVLIGLSLVGCGGGSSDSNTQNEFISLENRANFEFGEIISDAKKIELSYMGILMTTSKEYTGYIGIFAEKQHMQVLAMSSDNGREPNYKNMFVNIPDIPNGYECPSLQITESDSNMIQGASIYIVKAKDCAGRGENVGKTKDFTLKLTDSVGVAGSSRIEVKGTKAYLATNYTLNDELFLIGGLGTRTYNQIFDLHTQHPNVNTLVEGHISGSIHDDINMQTGRLVRKYGLATHLEANSDIASGGVDLFCSGKKRTMEDGAKVGVHSWSGDGVEASELPKESTLHQNQIDYFTEMLGSPFGKDFYFYTIYAASADDIHYMDNAEIAQYKLLTE